MKKKLQKGKAIEELVKGSLEYTQSLIRQAFRAQFPSPYDGPYQDIVDTFADYVIVGEYGSLSKLKSDEFWKVTYTRSGETFTFAPRDQWEVVELAYQPKTVISESQKKSGKRFEEMVAPSQVQLLEAKDETKKTRRIRINDFLVANQVNANKRLYSPEVIEAMVSDWQPYLRESRGQGRLMILTGEADHPSDKGKKGPEFLETVVRWDTLDWDGTRVNIEGDLILTSKGRDVETLMEAGVNPGGSIRGVGEAKITKVNGEKIEKVQWISMNAADLVGDPSFKNVAELQESQNQSSLEDEMDPEEILKLLKDHPELFKGITEAQIKEMGEAQLKALEAKIRTALGIDEKTDIAEALKATTEKAKKFEESQKQEEVKTAITEAAKDLPFGEKLNKIFVEAFQGIEFTGPEAVKQFAESQRKQFSHLASAGVLKGMGFDERTKSIKVLGDVLENENGVPEYGRVAFELTESVRKHENRSKRALVERAESPAAVFTEKVLERFDKLFQRFLISEARQFEEAEVSTDLNLPYSVSRAVIAEAFPNLVTANIFDYGVMEQSPMKIFYETFTGETGYEVAITDEVETGGAEETWYDLDHKNIVPGTVVVTSNPAGTTYVEGTDYVIDYELGKIKHLAAGSVGANDVLVTYTYHATRQGENAEIERAKVTLSSQTVDAIAYRLADYITHEAIVFSRAQIGWDAVGRTIANLIRQVRRDIDRSVIEKALAAALSVANNSGGTWDISDANYLDLVKKLGVAKVKVANRFYEPTSILMSKTNSDYLSNWDGFTRAGFPNAFLNAAGFAGGVKGLPVFDSTEMRDAWNLVSNRELVIHRVFQPMTIKGPFPTYSSNGKLIAAEQYYAEEYNANLAPIGGKGAVVAVQA